MKILIDMQGAQSTGSRNRGIGRYTQSLVRSLIRNKHSDDDIILLFSSAFWESIPDILREMDVDLSLDQIKVWHCNSMVNTHSGHVAERDSAELSREAYISVLAPDVVLITSIFEGLGDDVVISVGKFPPGIPTCVILYDLIPYLNRTIYLSDPTVEAWYERKLQELRQADVLLAISEASRQDGLACLGLPPDNVVNISSAVEGFSKQTIDAATEASLRSKYAIKGSFVLYTGGIDHRKNIETLIEAFSLLPADMLSVIQLVIVCSVQQVVRDKLLTLAKGCGLPVNSVVLTGFVPEDDLINLYNLCDLFVFPSLYEGFGLPVLEAMQCGAVVVGANTSSIPEVIGFERALFDPSDKNAMADKIIEGLTNEDFRETFRAHAAEQVQRFSWKESSTRTLATLRKAFEGRQKSNITNCRNRERPRLAYLSPLPPCKSGIADYSAGLLPELARFYDIDVVSESHNFAWASGAGQTVSIEYFRANSRKYDRVLYHFGNSEFHAHMFDIAEEIPGVVVLHDFFLSGVHHYMQVHALRPESFNHETFESHSYAGLYNLHSRPLDDVIQAQPCNFSVLSNALGIITHSRFSRDLAERFYGESAPQTWEVLPLARVLARLESREVARRKLGLEDNEVLVCSFGILAATKLNDRLLNAWHNLHSSCPQPINLVFVGEARGAYGAGIAADIERQEARGKARITGWVDQETYSDYLAAADIAVQLRGSSRGETSAAVLDCMSASLPTVVNANGSIAELPSDSVLMISDDFSDDELIDALKKLIQSVEMRTKLGRRGRQQIEEFHLPRQVASRYHDAIESAYSSPLNVRNRLQSAIARHAPYLTRPGLLALAQASARNFRPNGWQRQILIHMPERPDREWSNQLIEALKIAYRGYRLEPIATSSDGHARYVRAKTLTSLGLDPSLVDDEMIDVYDDDVIFTNGPNDVLRKLLLTTPGLVVKPIEELFQFLLPLERVEFG